VSTEPPKRKPAGLDLSDFAPPKAQSSSSATDKNSNERDKKGEKLAAQISAKQAGFTSREVGGGKIDGRSLRRTGRTEQLNIKVTPEVKERFWSLHNGENLNSSPAILEMLIDFYETHST